MSEKTLGTPHHSQWPELPKAEVEDLASLVSSPLDESPEFHDPYSDLNLFLAQKVKEEFKSHSTTKKWSIYVQEKLIEKISPEFRSRFPHYRLGVAALKKIWEKVAYFSQAFEHQKEALTQEGKLNLGFLIRENLKPFLGKKSFSFHPYLLAQQLALKISECLAAYDGIRPMVQHMTKMIWAVQRHLIPPDQMPATASPYEQSDTWDKLIIKFMVEALGKNRDLSQEELQSKVREALYNLDFMIEEEIINILIDHPQLDLASAQERAVQFFIKAKELAASANWIEIEHKITLWTVQGDLVYRCLRIEENQLLMLITHRNKENSEITQEYLRQYPFLAPFEAQVASRVEILSKFAWYALFSLPSQSTVERFMEWHLQFLSLQQLEELWKKQLPLLPFPQKQTK